MQTTNEIEPARKEQKTRGDDPRTANRYPADGKQVAVTEKVDLLPTWDEV